MKTLSRFLQNWPRYETTHFLLLFNAFQEVIFVLRRADIMVLWLDAQHAALLSVINCCQMSISQGDLDLLEC